LRDIIIIFYCLLYIQAFKKMAQALEDCHDLLECALCNESVDMAAAPVMRQVQPTADNEGDPQSDHNSDGTPDEDDDNRSPLPAHMLSMIQARNQLLGQSRAWGGRGARGAAQYANSNAMEERDARILDNMLFGCELVIQYEQAIMEFIKYTKGCLQRDRLEKYIHMFVDDRGELKANDFLDIFDDNIQYIFRKIPKEYWLTRHHMRHVQTWQRDLLENKLEKAMQKKDRMQRRTLDNRYDRKLEESLKL
jgi:hypothetical protein